ncbi:MAG: hypothetical protein A2Y33_02840 [Spirochaetes bacterium GWF1_51_8]|nr:MAG: hypothetical protein A2Y33_02840 [Spirochaetes bacterium GWF1_51_8]
MFLVIALAVIAAVSASCAGKPVNAESPGMWITGVWVRTDDAAAGTKVSVTLSNGLFYGYLLTAEGVLKNKFFSNECKWSSLTQTGKAEWQGGDLYRLAKKNHTNSPADSFGGGSNTGYLPCVIVLSDANTLYLHTDPVKKPYPPASKIEFPIVLPPQKWIKE